MDNAPAETVIPVPPPPTPVNRPTQRATLFSRRVHWPTKYEQFDCD